MDGREVIVAGVGLGELAVDTVNDFLDGADVAFFGLADEDLSDASQAVAIVSVDLGEFLPEFGLEGAWLAGTVGITGPARNEGHLFASGWVSRPLRFRFEAD